MRINYPTLAKRLKHHALNTALFDLSNATQKPSDLIDDKYFKAYSDYLQKYVINYIVELWDDGVQIDRFNIFLKLRVANFQNDNVPNELLENLDGLYTWQEWAAIDIPFQSTILAKNDDFVLLRIANQGRFATTEEMRSVIDYANNTNPILALGEPDLDADIIFVTDVNTVIEELNQ